MVEFTVLGSGSAGNCAVLKHDSRVLMIDAGFSARELGRRLATAGIPADRIEAILVSHEHTDHIRGLRVFTKCHRHIPVYANPLTAEQLRFRSQLPQNLALFTNGMPFQAGPFTIEPFSVSHDAADPVGFLITAGERKLGIVTDLGYFGKMVPLKLRDCHMLMIESNHDPQLLRNSGRPIHLQHRILGKRGHLSNERAAELVTETVGPLTRHLVMAHMSCECNKRELINGHITESLAAINRRDLPLEIAAQDQPCPTIHL